MGFRLGLDLGNLITDKARWVRLGGEEGGAGWVLGWARVAEQVDAQAMWSVGAPCMQPSIQCLHHQPPTWPVSAPALPPPALAPTLVLALTLTPNSNL